MTDTFANASSSSGGGSTPETGQQSDDVTGTLADLERKLRELERELTSIGRHRSAGDAAPTPQASAPHFYASPSRLPDEPAQASAQPTAAPAAAPIQPSPPQPSGRLVDEAIEPPPTTTLERVRPSGAQLASLAELRRFRDRLERFAGELATEYDALLSRVMVGLTSAAPSETAPPPAAATPPSPPPAATAEPADTAESGENALFEGRVELGVGPFYDIASLSAFERRLATLPGVSEAAVRRFEASHAVVDVRLATPVALVRELRRAAGSDFSVREVASGRVLLTFDES